jgi:hypothetical protein
MHQFMVDEWEPVDQSIAEPVSKTPSASVFSDLKLRHYLAFASLAVLLCAPIAWVLSGNWALPLLAVGLALLLVSVASLLAPDTAGYGGLE